MLDEQSWQLATKALTRILDSEGTDPQTVDDAVRAVLGGAAVTDPRGTEATLMGVVTGAVRFLPICDGALQGYCDSLKRNKMDRAAMYLIAYLVVFKKEEMDEDRMRRLFYKQIPAPRLAEYLAYLADENMVRKFSVPFWSQTYDANFINNTILRGLAGTAPAMRRVATFLETTAGPVTMHHDEAREQATEGPAASSPSQAGSSVAQPARGAAAGGAKARPAGLPPAEVREMAYTIPEARPPAVRRGNSPSSAAAAAGALAKGPARAAVRPAPAASSRTPRARPEADQAAGCSASPPVIPTRDVAWVRRMMQKELEVPMTNAALRREAHLHQQRLAEKERRMRELEAVQRDESEYEQWRAAERAKEEQRQEMLILERRIATMEAGDIARAAREEIEEKRRRQIQAMKRRANADLEEVAAAQEEARVQQRGHVHNFREQLAKSRRNAEARAARERLRAAEEVKQETAEAREAARVKEEQRRLEQAVVINEIRQLRERIRQRQAELIEQRRNDQGYELPEDAGTADAALGTLTVAQLREQLEQVRAQERALEEERRLRIAEVRGRESRERLALERLCRNQRSTRQKERERQLSEKASSAAAKRAAQFAADTEKMDALRAKLEEQRTKRQREHRRMVAVERQLKNEANMCAADENAMEQERWRQLEQGVVNRVAASQATRRN